MDIVQEDFAYRVRPRATGQPRELVGLVARQVEGTTTRNVLNVYGPAVLLEVHDNYFHHGSAVMMPDVDGEDEPEPGSRSHFEEGDEVAGLRRCRPDSYGRFLNEPFDPADEDGDTGRVSGLGLLVAAYRFQKVNPAYRLLLAGHADTSGDAGYNFTISELRAKNVLHLLLGERAPWVDICLAKSKVEDYQRIVKHYATVFSWACDPGPINDVHDAATRAAVREFQARYNARFKKTIMVDGAVGRETWGAFFDCYMEELAALLKVTVAELPGKRTVTFLDTGQRYIACGEQKPIDHPERDAFRSKENRRVEFLFFRPPFVPDLSCHAGTKPYCMKRCPREECGVYAPGRFDFLVVAPRSLLGHVVGDDYQPQFEITTTDHDLTELPDAPDESYDTHLQLSAVADDDPWAFLEPFAALEPDEGSSEQRPPGAQGRRT